MRAHRILRRETLNTKVKAMKKMQQYFIKLGVTMENLRIRQGALQLEYGATYEVAGAEYEVNYAANR